MKKKKKVFCWLIFIGILVSYLPLIYICRYNCPSADDYNYAINTFRVWNETHSVWAVIKEAVHTSIYFWNHWQGLYISAFLLALQPAVFGTKWYALTGIIMLVLIVGSTLIFSNYFICRLLKRNRLEGMTIGMAVSFMMIQFMPSSVEGIYWFNGAVNYGFFFAVLLIYICVFVELQRENSKITEIVKLGGCLTGIFLLEGGNHVTALMGIVFTAGISFVNFRKNKRKTVQNLIILCAGLGFLYLNLSSPGTAVRYGAIEATLGNYGILETIVAATCKGIESVGTWFSLKEIVMIVLLLPILTEITVEIRKCSGFRFRYPLVVLIASVAWLCLMYCPPYMAMGSEGQGRLLNLVYYSFEILFFIDITYFLGWFQEMMREDTIEKLSLISWKYMATLITLGAAFLVFSGKDCWSYQAVEEIYIGEAWQYYQEFQEREKLIKSTSEKDLIVPELSVHPEVLFFDDITDDVMDWKNISAADYYGLESIATE